MQDLAKSSKYAPTATTRVRELLEAAYAPNTLRAYRSDIEAFLDWGGTIPTTPDQVARFISDRTQTHSIATVKRQLSALSNLHSSLEVVPNPIQSPLIVKTLRGATRIHGKPQRAVEPLLIEDLRIILDQLPSDIVGIRDAALLTIGFAGAFRRSELVALDYSDVQEVKAGLKITICRSKTDQLGVGRAIAIPFGRGRYCPIRYFVDWVRLVDSDTGPIFRGCAKGGKITENRLSPEAVAQVVKRRVAEIGHQPNEYSGHSLRSGYVTSAVRAGATENAIRRQTGHASSTSLGRYIRLADLFEDNATQLLF